MMDIEEASHAIPNLHFEGDARRDYQTIGGFVVSKLGHIPKEGETFECQGYVFEVVDMDRHRVDKVLLLQTQKKPGSCDAPG